MMPKPPLARYTDWTLLLLRLSVGATFVAHGMMKWGNFGTPSTDAMSFIMKVLAVVEPIAGAMLIIGMAVEVAGTALVIVMLGAIWTKFSGGGGFVGKGAWEFDLLLLSANAVLLSVGCGKYSLDAACARNERHWWQFWKRG